MTNYTATQTAEQTSVFAKIRENLVFHEIVAVVFHTFMLFRGFFCEPGPERTTALQFGVCLWLSSVVAIFLVRGELVKPSPARAIFYRLAIFAPFVISYFEMMFLLPALKPTLLDMELYAIDRVLFFGSTPALWMQQFNEPAIVEWIAFFYYSYFYLMASMLIPTLFFDRGRRMIELLVGACLVASIGHTLYTFVPGVGPFRTIEFNEALNGGLFWGLVVDTVSSAGAQMDIFPSLHTAYPTLFALHAFGNRHTKPFKYVWPIIAFFAFNMIIATMFLRWHWGIDVIAGLMVAFAARSIGVRVAKREMHRGTTTDPRQPVWYPIRPKHENSDGDGEGQSREAPILHTEQHSTPAPAQVV